MNINDLTYENIQNYFLTRIDSAIEEERINLVEEIKETERQKNITLILSIILGIAGIALGIYTDLAAVGFIIGIFIIVIGLIQVSAKEKLIDEIEHEKCIEIMERFALIVAIRNITENVDSLLNKKSNNITEDSNIIEAKNPINETISESNSDKEEKQEEAVWVCLKCGTTNSVEDKFCQNCEK